MPCRYSLLSLNNSIQKCYFGLVENQITSPLIIEARTIFCRLQVGSYNVPEIFEPELLQVGDVNSSQNFGSEKLQVTRCSNCPISQLLKQVNKYKSLSSHVLNRNSFYLTYIFKTFITSKPSATI